MSKIRKPMIGVPTEGKKEPMGDISEEITRIFTEVSKRRSMNWPQDL